MSELGKSSPHHRGGLDAGDTDSVDLTPENHGPHRMNRKQTANVYNNAYKSTSITISDASESVMWFIKAVSCLDVDQRYVVAVHHKTAQFSRPFRYVFQTGMSAWTERRHAERTPNASTPRDRTCARVNTGTRGDGQNCTRICPREYKPTL